MSVRVKRGGKVLRIDETELQHYLQKGYDRVDIGGTVIQEAVAHDNGALKERVREYQAKIAELEGVIANLTAELEAVKSAGKKKSTAKK